MFKILSFAALLAASAAAQSTPGSPHAPLVFDVASVKPAAPLNPAMIMAGKMKIGMNVSGTRVDIGFLSLTNLICLAYEVKDYQVTGPDWLGTQRFDITARMPEGSTKEQMPEMMRALLEERFHLKIHKGSKEHAMYALVVAKGGPKLKEVTPPPAPEPGAAPAAPAVSFKQTGAGKGEVSANGPSGPMKMTVGEGGGMHMQMNMTTANLAAFLSRFAGKPVSDETQLKGTYEMSLDMPADSLRAMVQSAGIAIPGLQAPAGGGAGLPLDSASDPAGSTIFTTVQQMGLKLEPQKKAVETIVVDSAEKNPIEN